MQANQKSSKDGIQNILFPTAVMKITQGNNGTYSHQGINALDLGGNGTRFPLYAPVDVVCKFVDKKEGNGNAVIWQSKSKVRFADGTIDYVTLMIIHDNSLDGIYVGVEYPQGFQIANAGDKGRVTGIHSHFEIAKGVYTKAYEQSSSGVWHLPGSISADRACYIDNTEIQNGNGMAWKRTNG